MKLHLLGLVVVSCAFAADDAALLKQRVEALEREVATLKEENKKLREIAPPVQSYESVGDCLNKRGHPALIANFFRFDDRDSPTISFYQLDKTADFALFTKRDRYLVYTSDIRFAQHVGYHFSGVLNPDQYSGSTMFGAVMWPTDLELVHFDPDGKFVDSRHYMIVIAYFEAGAEGHLIRRPVKIPPAPVTPPSEQTPRKP